MACSYSDEWKAMLLEDFNCSSISYIDRDILNLLNSHTDHCLRPQNVSSLPPYCDEAFVRYSAAGTQTEDFFIVVGGVLQLVIAYMSAAMSLPVPFFIFVLLSLNGQSTNAQHNTPEYNQAAYRAKREMHLFQLAEWSRKKDSDFIDAIKYQMTTTILQVLSNAKDVLDKLGANDPSRVPSDPEAGDAWALVVENSALLCELLVRFPETANSLKNQSNNRQIVAWALDFLLASQYPNKNDEQLIHFAKIELDLTPRPKGYLNPFSGETQKVAKDILKEELKRKKREELRKQARKPRLSRREDL
ncbi:hypothetical protein Aperf_G00000028207 [Anoplocephala perfoliata]